MPKKPSLVERMEKQVVTGGIKAAESKPDGAKSVAPLKAKIEKSKTPAARGKSYTLDLRVHSPASQDYFGIDGIDPAPAIVRLAKVKGLDMIALTDYYSASFVDRVMEAAKGSPVTVIPGIDLRCVVGTCDDTILTCLFPESYASQQLEEFLTKLQIPQSARGNKQHLVRMPFEQILELVESLHGMVIPSRMDGTPHRLSVVPLLVEKYGFRVFDLAYADSLAYFKQRWPKIKFHLVNFSNANSLAQIGSRTARVKMTGAGFAGLRELFERVPA